jgi:hypothetical protein
VKGKLANGEGGQYFHATSENDVSSIATAYAHTTAASSQLKQAKPKQAKVLTGGGDLRFAQVDVPLSVRHFCV